MSDHTFDPSDAYERPEVFDLTPNAITATQPWEADGTSLALTAASLLNELRPLVVAALDWDDADRRRSQLVPRLSQWVEFDGRTWRSVTSPDAREAFVMALDALSEDAHLWARGEALVDDQPSTFAVGPAPESVFDSEEGDQLGGWPEPTYRTATLADALGVPSDRSIYFGLALVGAEMARLLDVYADGADSMEHKQEAADALDAFRSLHRSALAELVAKPGATT